MGATLPITKGHFVMLVGDPRTAELLLARFAQRRPANGLVGTVGGVSVAAKKVVADLELCLHGPTTADCEAVRSSAEGSGSPPPPFTPALTLQ